MVAIDKSSRSGALLVRYYAREGLGAREEVRVASTYFSLSWRHAYLGGVGRGCHGSYFEIHVLFLVLYGEIMSYYTTVLYCYTVIYIRIILV